MPMHPGPANVVVVALLMAAILTACELKVDAAIPDQSANDKLRAGNALSVVPVLGIRG